MHMSIEQLHQLRLDQRSGMNKASATEPQFHYMHNKTDPNADDSKRCASVLPEFDTDGFGARRQFQNTMYYMSSCKRIQGIAGIQRRQNVYYMCEHYQHIEASTYYILPKHTGRTT